MADVFLDGEKVDFQGAEPDSSGSLWELLDGHLGQQGRVLDQLILDGRAWSPGESNCGYERAEAASVTQGARIEVLLASVLNSGDSIAVGLDALSRKCLSQLAETTREEAMALVDQVKPFLEVLGLVDAYGKNFNRDWSRGLSEALSALNEAIGAWLDALESGKSIVLSDCTVRVLAPSYTAVFEFAKSSVLGKVEASSL